MSKYIRKCPNCKTRIIYSRKNAMDRANKNNTKCKKTCSNIKLGYKKCSYCKLIKRVNMFGKDSYSTSGLTHRCRKCRNKTSKLNSLYQKQWRANNLTKSRSHGRKYYLKNKHLFREHKRRRRARLLGVKENFTEIEWNISLKAFSNKCVNCGSIEKLCRDHHRPLVNGYPLNISNCVVLCKSCNSSKGITPPEKFYNKRKYNKIEKILNRLGNN